MGILRTIKCDTEGCEKKHTETEPGGGWPGWGHVAGIMNDETGETTAYLCPEHLGKVKEVLNGMD